MFDQYEWRFSAKLLKLEKMETWNKSLRISMNCLNNITIVVWNVKTLKVSYRVEVSNFWSLELHLLLISEIHLPGLGNTKLDDVEQFHSEWKVGAHRQAVGLMMSKAAFVSRFSWKGINNWILVTHFMIKKCMIAVIVVFVPVEPTDGAISDSSECCIQQQEDKNRIRGKNVSFFCIGDL